MSALKDFARGLARPYLSRPSVFRRWCSDSICVFLYHDVTDRPSAFSRRYGHCVEPALFKRQVSLIQEHFYIITPDELLSGDHPKPAALITFDDGFPGYFENAVPILSDLQVPSIIFLNMAAVRGEPFWAGLLSYLCDEDRSFRAAMTDRLDPAVALAFPMVKDEWFYLQLKKEWVEEYLRQNGREAVWERVREFHGGFSTIEHLREAAGKSAVYFGSHLFNHYNAAALDESQLREAYLKNLEALRPFSNFRELFSYPFGVPGLCYTKDTNGLLFGLGAKRLFSSFPQPNIGKTKRLLHRIELTQDIESEEDLLLRINLPILKQSVFGQTVLGE